LTGTNTGTNTVALQIVNDPVSGATTGVTKSGAGTWVLTGSSSYTGATTVGGGVLSISNDYNIGASTGPVIFNGGTLQIMGTDDTALGAGRALTLTGTAILEINNAANNYTISQ